MKKILIALIVAFVSIVPVNAASITDPVLVEMILLYENQTKKALRAQEAAMMAITSGHIWTKEEVEGVYNLQKEYNSYLDQFNGLLVYAAQGYGFYHEVGKLTENFGKLTKQLKASPMNAVAVALTPKRNKIYRELIMTSVDIVNDIRQVCLSDIKMTEKQRMEIVFGIRPKLKKINKKLMHLALAVKYTSLNDVWLEIDNRARNPLNKTRIADAAFRRWRNNGKVTVKPGGGIIIGPIVPAPDKPIIGPGRPPWIRPDLPLFPVDSLVKPIDPIKPVEPADTVKPDEPIDPIKPIFPDKPLLPIDTIVHRPIDPIKPIDPITPIKPEPVPDPKPLEPINPDKPNIGTGLKPINPNLPERPLIPSQNQTIKDPVLSPLSKSRTVSKTKSKTTSNFNTIR